MNRRAFLSSALVAASPAAAESKPLYLLTYDHGGLVLWGIPHFTERLREAISWLERYPGFKIGLDNEAYTYDFLAEHDPKLLDEIRGYLKKFDRRFGIGTCTYGQPLSTFINEESNIRQIQFALEAARRYFRTAPPIYLMSEHAMHCQIPQIVAGFGFKGAIMRTHFMMYGYNPTFDAPVGWWIGPDGSRIPTVPTYKGQGAEFGRTTVDNWILTRCPGPECRGSLQEFKTRFAHIDPLLASRADDSGLRREGLVRETESDPTCRWVLLDDLLRVLPEPRAEFKTGPNDFAVRMPWGYCGNEIWNRSRRAEVSVLTAERLAALEVLLGGENREATIDRSWKNLLVAQHHDIQICGLLPDARKFLSASLDASEGSRAASLQFAASQMEGGSTAQITVFNPCSWPRKEWVEAAFTIPRGFGKALEVRDGDRSVPSVLISALRSSNDSLQEARVAVLADPPPLGVASYSIAPAAPSEEKPVTAYWEMALGPQGGLVSVASRATGIELLKNARFAGRIDDVPCESSGKWSALPAPPGARWMRAREDGSIGGIPYRLHLTAWSDSPRLDFRVTFDLNDQKIGAVSQNKRDSRSPFVHEEKLRFRFYAPSAAGGIGIRDLPFVVAETKDPYIQGNYWTALASEKAGVAVFNRGTMCLVREADGALSIPLAYAMYYIWGTRMLSGEFSFEFALYPFEGGWTSAGLHRAALEYNFPCQAIAGTPGTGKLGRRIAPLEIDSDGAVASALFHRDGKTFLRLYEHRGLNAAASIRLRGQAPRLISCDLSGRETGPAESPLRFTPWQIRTFRVG